MSELKIERLGGFGGFGLPGSHIRSQGSLKIAQLTPHVRAKVEKLFEDSDEDEAPSAVNDGFRYRITLTTSHGSQTIEVPEAVVPDELQASVRDELL